MSGSHHPLDFVDQVAEVEGLGQDLGILRSLESGCRATAAKPVMTMILSEGSSSEARRASSMPSISGMTMSGQQEIEAGLLDFLEALAPSPKEVTSWPAFSSAFTRKTAHVLVVFGPV